MGFLDKAKAAAMDLQQKADTAMSNSGLMGGNAMGSPGGGGSGSSSAAADRLLRNLGVLTYLNASGRPGATEDYHRIMDELRGLEASGGLNLTLTPAAPAGYGGPGAPPPPPGAVAASAAGASVGGASVGGTSSAASPPPPPPAPVVEAPAALDVPAVDVPAVDVPAVDGPAIDVADGGEGAIIDVQEEVIDVGGGGGTAPAPPPPSWA
ncbi:hypothetical protein [Nostocoides sp.]|jgi:hypothetical protein|uniref:hypothetical protein n=3 Tax=Nostocoides sp. TaxID=1917966 RepID=UPI003BAF330D